jgi:subfamily B ATP-binding cassette protein HlyB/CyaB
MQSSSTQPRSVRLSGSPVPASESADPGPVRVDTGLAGLVLIARYHGKSVEPAQLRHEQGRPGAAFGLEEILLAAKRIGLRARSVSVAPERLETTPLPALARARDGRFFVVARADSQRVLVHLPELGRPEAISREDFEGRYAGTLILCASSASRAGELARFDFTWFIPAIVKYRRQLAEVLLVSLCLQLFGLATPLFFQVVMDKVLVHRGFATLDVIAVGLLIVSVFEVALTGLRSYVFAHTTSRMDVELGARLFRHLLGLPLSYFEVRRVGDSVARVRELESIRSFLTGNAITLVLDLAFSGVFLAFMLTMSVELTGVVIVSLVCYALLSLALTPVLRRRLHEKFQRGAENQSFLVETVSGIGTVKAMAVEPAWTREWDQQLAAYVSASFRATTLGTLATAGVSLTNKLVTAATLYWGAHAVIEGGMTVGQLIAFNMLAGQVARPVMRIAQLWTDFQQTGIAMQRMGDILDTRPELAGNKSSLPPLRGSIEFQDVSFRYRPGAAEVLRGIDWKVDAGEVVGIVGRSGSGKSTLTKLVQRLYVPERGRVLVDGIDVALANPSSLRRQIGVVLQDNVLFNRSIRDNIALIDPGAPLERVIAAAKTAGAHEFVAELTEGYDTIVGEHGSTLSGGQRQRIAIARALLVNPRILILDEATSALDYESERIIQDNMQAICQGRTVLIIAHRLSAVRAARRIFVVEKGQIAASGTHDELLADGAGLYARLHRLQQGGAA